MRRSLTCARWLGIMPAVALLLNPAAHAQWGSAAAAPPPAVAPGNTPQPISTRQSSFAIPYTIPVPKTPAETPAEIRLFVSSDQGKSWNMAEATKLNAITETQRGQFTFRAPGDAEYWFAIRTVDRAGQLRGGRNGPELRVIVDAQPPVIKLDAQRGAAGEVAIRYDVTDAALQPQSLALSYQLSGMTDWRSISFDKPFGAVPEKPLQGTTTFWPERAGVELQVRLEILDAAGNNGVSQVAVPVGHGATGQPVARNLNEATTPWTGQPSSPAATPAGAPALPPNFGQQNTGLQNPAVASRPGVRHDDPPPAFPFGDTSQPSGTRWQDVTNTTPARTISNSPTPTMAPPQSSLLGPPTPPASIAGLPSGPALFGPQDNPPAYPGNASTPSNISISPAMPGQPQLAQQPQASPVAPRVESRVTAPYEPAPVTGLREYRLPTGEQPRMVNGRTFEWDYELESVGAAGIAKIELWMTRDGGNSWASVGVDPDNRSPVRTMVDGEGLFGYRMTVQSAGGAQPRPPQSGEQPEMWIGVDLTKPYARLLNAELGQGSAQGEIAITWEAKDALLARQPVSLAFAERKEGPWTTIAAGLENTGRYAWRYDSQTPERLYLRLEVRDEAGNIGVSESIEPLSLERTNPAVRLRNVRPVQEGNPQSRITPAPNNSVPNNVPTTTVAATNNTTPRYVATQPQPVINTTIPARNSNAVLMQANGSFAAGQLPIVLPSPESMTSSPPTTVINNMAASATVPRTSTNSRTTTPPSTPSMSTTQAMPTTPMTPPTPRSTVWSTPSNANPSTMSNPYLQPSNATIRR
jgi:hypothetical protein